MESAKRIMQRQANKISDSVLGNNITFDWQVVLLRRRISDGITKEHTEIVNGKCEGNDFVMHSMKQTGRIFSRSRDNKKSGKGGIRADIKSFQQTMFLEMISTHDVRKLINRGWCYNFQEIHVCHNIYITKL